MTAMEPSLSSRHQHRNNNNNKNNPPQKMNAPSSWIPLGPASNHSNHRLPHTSRPCMPPRRATTFVLSSGLSPRRSMSVSLSNLAFQYTSNNNVSLSIGCEYIVL